jgi:hypothetical protein
MRFVNLDVTSSVLSPNILVSLYEIYIINLIKRKGKKSNLVKSKEMCVKNAAIKCCINNSQNLTEQLNKFKN